MGPWILGVAMACLSLIGLFVASAAGGGAIYATGLTVFVAGVIVIFILIRRGTAPAKDGA